MTHQSKSTDSDSAQEIELGDLQEAPLLSRRRPDVDKQYAVAPVFAPNANDLAIFVDLDALREMEVHAATDTNVELGGVLLGGQYQDDSGHPFVLVTDCLRAEHYEATKGSFKFTHDTWQQITRQRTEFPEELQMVGWYHTHPDWGVFLSSMDLFICENFFNKTLDLALVIDPCRHSLGFFQWTDPGESTRKVDGFYLVASRFREAELARFVEWIEEKPMLSNDPRFQGTSNPIVQLHNQTPSVYPLAVLATLAIQFCLLAVIAWRVLAPSAAAPTAAPPEPPDFAQIGAARQREIEVDAKVQVLERLLGDGGGTRDDLVASLADRTGQVAKLEHDLLAHRGFEESLRQRVTESQSELTEAKQAREKLSQQLEELQDELVEVKAANRLKLDELQELTGTAGTSGGAAGGWSWLWLAAATIAGLVCGGVFGAMSRTSDHSETFSKTTKDKNEVTNTD